MAIRLKHDTLARFLCHSNGKNQKFCHLYLCAVLSVKCDTLRKNKQTTQRCNCVEVCLSAVNAMGYSNEYCPCKIGAVRDYTHNRIAIERMCDIAQCWKNVRMYV